MNKIKTRLTDMGYDCVCEGNEDVSDFIHDIKNNEHCILMFENEEIRDKIVQEFFNPKFMQNVTTACFSQKPSKFDCEHEITYDELIKNEKLEPMVVSDFLLSVINKSSTPDSTRIACEDTSWFAEEGFFEEHQKLGNSMDSRVIDYSTLLCCYNITKLDDEQLNKVLSSRNYIILEEPFSVYKKSK